MSTAMLGTRRPRSFAGKGPRSVTGPFTCGVLFLAIALLAAAPSSAQVSKNVLVLTSEATGMPGLAMVVDQTLSALRTVSGPVNIYIESIDSSRFPANADRMAALYKERYANRRLDLLVTVCGPALDFALRHRNELFPGVPTLFSFVDPGMVTGIPPGANISGVFVHSNWHALIELALRLHPHVHSLLVVSGTSAFDHGWLASLDQVIHAFDSRVAVTRLTDLSLRDLLAAVATAPEDSVILYLSVSRDRDGAAYVPRDVLDMVRRVSAVPVYGPSITFIGHGAVGGPVMDLQAHGADLGQMAMRVLAGERPDHIKPITSRNTLVFDWRELQRFHVSEAALPPGATVLYREASFWTLHQGWVVATICLLLAQTTLIGLMLAQRRRRTALEHSLTERLRFETMLSDVSASLGGVPVPQMEIAVRAAVGMLRQYAAVDRVAIFELGADGKAIRIVDDAAPASPPVPDVYSPADLPSITLTLTSLQPFVLDSLDHLPAEAARERETLRQAGIRSIVLVPLEVGGNTLGILSCVSHRKEVKWSADFVQQLRTLAQVLANLIQRRQTDAAVSKSDKLRGSILSSMPAHIAVLDGDGVIIAVNDAWTEFGRANGVQREASTSPGASYLDVCRRGAEQGAPGAAEALAGIEAVCQRKTDLFESEYRCDGAKQERWFALKVVPLRRPEGGAVVTHRDITAEKRQELALRESEKRFRVLADALPIGVWMTGLDKGCTYFNQEWLEFAGRPMEAETGHGWVERVHADDVLAVFLEYTRAFDAREPFSLVYRLRRHDGAYRWMFDQGSPRYDTAGTFEGFIGGCVDITDRVEAERRHRDLSGRLITAQEDERRRIARELHDDLQQRLALLAIELDGIALRQPPPAGDDLTAEARRLWQQTVEISTEIHNLSYRLHPSKLEALGLLPTLEGYCRELAQRGLRVTFSQEGMPRTIPADVSLCVFRVVQESLQNVMKHSGVTDARLTMSGADGVLRLSISDDGRGFEPAAASVNGGLGLISMRERLHLVGGDMTIRSVPGGGTSIEFQVPLRGGEAGVDSGDARRMGI